MKRIIIFAIAFILTASFSFAAASKAKSKEEDIKVIATTEEKEIIGKVRAISVENPLLKETKDEIIVTDDEDKSSEKAFLINQDTIIYNAKKEYINLDDISVNDKVSVRYITSKGDVLIATLINILK